jgi:nitroimidazol reductase NimA-like FMN-containing flavoprotein (pyridoxamine 5'-phosphate oxidase superfamily)
VSKAPANTKFESKAKIVELLQENRVMSIATIRSDGWPQATMVGYVHDDLTLYFVVARLSQKFANIAREPRVSISLGHDAPNRLRGLSMAAHAAEVTDPAEIEHLNALLLERYPEQSIFSPREPSAAVLRATPIVVSIIDLARGPGEPQLVEIDNETTVDHVQNTANETGRPIRVNLTAGRGKTVLVQYTHPTRDKYRPGAPF